MIGTSTIVAVLVTLFITLPLPLIVYIIYGIRNKGKGVWMAWAIGAAGFFITQVIIRLPILNVVSLLPGYANFVTKHYVLYCFLLALTAALFEFVGRFVVAKILTKKASYECGFAAGLGHGSIEAMVLVGMTYVNNLLYIFMINSGTFDVLVEQTIAAGADASVISQLEAIPATFLNTAPAMFYLGGFERILAVIGHIAMSLIVCYFVWNKQALKGSIICIIWHFILDFGSVMLNSLATPYLGNVVSTNTGYVLTYGFLVFMTIIAVVVIIKLKKKMKNN